jgi:hypothetical protein
MGSPGTQTYTGPERRAVPRRPAANGVVAYARFRAPHGTQPNYRSHDQGPWYRVWCRNDAAEDPIAPPHSVWLEMEVVRAVPRAHLEIRGDLRRPRSASRRGA